MSDQTQPVQSTPSASSTAAVQEEASTAAQEERLFPGIPRPQPKQAVISWNAPSRPFKKRDRQYYTTVTAIIFLVSLILFFAGQFLPIAVVISVGFLAYVMSSVPPHDIKVEINTYGIEIENILYPWEEMGRFWLDKKYDQDLLTIEVMRFPGRIILMFEENKKEELRKILSEVLLEEKPADTFYDKASKWLQEKIPLEFNS